MNIHPNFVKTINERRDALQAQVKKIANRLTDGDAKLVCYTDPETNPIRHIWIGRWKQGVNMLEASIIHCSYQRAQTILRIIATILDESPVRLTGGDVDRILHEYESSWHHQHTLYLFKGTVVTYPDGAEFHLGRIKEILRVYLKTKHIQYPYGWRYESGLRDCR